MGEELLDEAALREIREERTEKSAIDGEMRTLRRNKKANYTMLRRLQPVTDKGNLGAVAFMSEFILDYPLFNETIMRFEQWQQVEEGEVQVRESSNEDADAHGYLVVRPTDDKEHDLYLRVWAGMTNSVVILPRIDGRLPARGKKKEEIMWQMKLVSEKEIRDYNIWIKRMKKAAENLASE